MSFWAALAEIESGGNDYAVGDVGEISRYQIRPEVWRTYSSSRRYTDSSVALPIAEKYMAKLRHDFERATGREPTETDCVILWKSGIAGYEKHGFNPAHMSAAHRDRINRFRNLRMPQFTLLRAAAQKLPQPTAADMQKPAAVSATEMFSLKCPVESETFPAPFGISASLSQASQTDEIFRQARPEVVSLLTPCPLSTPAARR